MGNKRGYSPQKPRWYVSQVDCNRGCDPLTKSVSSSTRKFGPAAKAMVISPRGETKTLGLCKEIGLHRFWSVKGSDPVPLKMKRRKGQA